MSIENLELAILETLERHHYAAEWVRMSYAGKGTYGRFDCNDLGVASGVVEMDRTNTACKVYAFDKNSSGCRLLGTLCIA